MGEPRVVAEQVARRYRPSRQEKTVILGEFVEFW